MLIETHCHLDYLKSTSLEEILKSSRDVGIEKIITIGVDPENLDKVKLISDQNEMVYYSQGIHPHDSKDASEFDFEKIKSRTNEVKMVAIGEIGLDYHYNNSPQEIQKKIFELQLQIASDHDLPVIIHTREADDDTIAILKNFSSHLKKRGVIHSFTSSKELAEWVLSENFFLGFNGIITFKNAKNVQEIVEITPREKILLETDSPFLTPVPHRGKENAPFYLPFVAEKISELKKISLEEVKKQCVQNSLDCFFKLGR
jgi:TatD DNase family protein